MDTSGEIQTLADTPVAAGYAHPRYAASLAEFGAPRRLPRCGGWLLDRRIPDSPHSDAMGCYPLFCCEDWSALGEDLDELKDELVSVVLVTDPFADVDAERLASQFDRAVHFKDHYVAELDRPVEQIIKKSHRATVRRALRRVEVSVCPRPPEYLDSWVELFARLAERHHIKGLRAFSRRAFAEQLAIPGMVMFAARSGGELVGLDLWYVQGDVAYGHLVAFSDEGYRRRASYATKWHLMHYFQDKVRWIDFGAGAGTAASKSDGLAAFKQGWSTGTKPVYLCGRTLQPRVYEELAAARRVGATSYFPAYRCGEFA